MPVSGIARETSLPRAKVSRPQCGDYLSHPEWFLRDRGLCVIHLCVLSALHTLGRWDGSLRLGSEGCWGPGIVCRGGGFAESILGGLNLLDDGK